MKLCDQLERQSVTGHLVGGDRSVSDKTKASIVTKNAILHLLWIPTTVLHTPIRDTKKRPKSKPKVDNYGKQLIVT
jgi:hypothetical protein